MEIITQVFPDDFHLRTLQPFLSATAQLHPKVNVKQIIIALIDRLAAYAAREAEGEEPGETKKQREENIRRIADIRKRKLQGLPVEEEEPQENEPVEEKKEIEESAENEETSETLAGDEEVTETNDEDKADEEQEQKENEKEEDSKVSPPEEEENQAVDNDDTNVRKIRGIPEDVELFVVFWGQIVELVKARPDLTVQDLTALLVSLINLSLSCYPEKLDYVDQILAFAKDKVLELSDLPDLHSKATESNLLSLLLAPIQHYSSVITLLALASYQPLLALQPYSSRQSIAYAIVQSVLKNSTIIDIPEDVHGILDLCDVLLRDQKDAPVSAATLQPAYGSRQKQHDLSFDQEEYVEKQGLLARMIHMFRSDDEDTQFLVTNVLHLYHQSLIPFFCF